MKNLALNPNALVSPRSVVVALFMFWALSCPAPVGGPFNPTNFASLGANPFTANGTYTVHTAGTPELRDPANGLAATGVVSNGVAVFTFDSINIGAGVTVFGARETNSRPFALLSKAGVILDGVIDASGQAGIGFVSGSGLGGGNAGPGGGGGGGGGGASGSVGCCAPGPGGAGGAGQVGGSPGGNGSTNAPPFNAPGGSGGSIESGGAGVGGPANQGGGGGGAFGGDGAAGCGGVGLGGTAYGNLELVLEGGSGGGGGGGATLGGAGGGGGGGAVEIVAIGNIEISGRINVQGGAGGGRSGDAGTPGGGGAGGGILLSGDLATISSSGSLQAGGGSAACGGGGGGRVYISGSSAIRADLATAVNVAGADGGAKGVLTTIGTICPLTRTVVNTDDSGPGSLRQAILDANSCPGKDVIVFAPSAYGTILLTNGELLITGDLDILGPGATNVAVDGNAAGRVFHVGPGINVTIAGLTITKGLANSGSPGDRGGGIYNDHSTLTVSNCTIGNNVANYGGGLANDGAISGSATLKITGTTLSANSAVAGGGIFSDGQFNGATLEIVNSTFSGNSASFVGGGVYGLGLTTGIASVSVLNSTFDLNSGGGIVVNGSRPQATPAATLHIGSTILNASVVFGTNGAAVTSLGYNLSSDSGGGFFTTVGDQINTDPMLGPLQLNGGQTPTHALLCGSPAIDAGTNFLGLATDQRGALRTFDDPAIPNPGDGTDIGAFEFQISCPVALCTNVTVSADSNCVATASIDNGSYAPDGGVSITNRVQTPPGPYVLGTNDVTLTVTDSHGLSSSCQGIVVVVDTTPPDIIRCATAATNSADAHCQAPVPDFTTNVVAQDNCPLSGQLAFSQSPSAGTLVSLGTTNVTIYVADPSGNTNTCLTTFTVVDTTPPTIHCPTNIMATNDAGQCSAVVNYTVSADDNCGSVTLSEDFPSGSTFSKGANTVTVTGVDLAGNTNTCSFTITVLDKEAPRVNCRPAPNPSGKVSEPGKNGSTGVNPNGYYELLAKDNCDANPKIYIKDTGSTFVAGPFKNGDVVRLKHAGGAPSSAPGTPPIVAVISLKGNGLSIAKDADGNTTPDASGCVMAVSLK